MWGAAWGGALGFGFDDLEGGGAWVFILGRGVYLEEGSRNWNRSRKDLEKETEKTEVGQKSY